MSQTISNPLLTPARQGVTRYMAVIYNNDSNTFDEVIEVVMKATGCDVEQASIEVWEAHTYGRAPVHFASEEECLRVASVIQSIGVHTEVVREWDD